MRQRLPLGNTFIESMRPAKVIVANHLSNKHDFHPGREKRRASLPSHDKPDRTAVRSSEDPRLKECEGEFDPFAAIGIDLAPENSSIGNESPLSNVLSPSSQRNPPA